MFQIHYQFCSIHISCIYHSSRKSIEVHAKVYTFKFRLQRKTFRFVHLKFNSHTNFYNYWEIDTDLLFINLFFIWKEHRSTLKDPPRLSKFMFLPPVWLLPWFPCNLYNSNKIAILQQYIFFSKKWSWVYYKITLSWSGNLTQSLLCNGI